MWFLWWLIILQVGQKLGDQWKELSNDAKAPFEKLAANDKLRYKADIAACKPENSIKKEKKVRDPNQVNLKKRKKSVIQIRLI